MKTKTNRMQFAGENRFIYFAEIPRTDAEIAVASGNTGQETAYQPLERKEKMTRESHANAPHVIASCMQVLLKSARMQGAEWALPDQGKALEAQLARLNQELPQLQQYIESKASKGKAGVVEINQWLKSKGFNIQLDPKSVQEGDDVAASTMDIKVEWIQEGKTTKLNLATGEQVDAVHMKDVEEIYQSNHKYPIVALATKTGEKVFMTKYDEAVPSNSVGVKTIIEKINSGKTKINKANVTFPMVDYDSFKYGQKELTEVLGATAIDDNGNFINVSQALFQYKFRMNEKGARAQAAVAMAVSKGVNMSFKEIKIDGPFLAWFETNGNIIPFSAYISKDDMKKPANLD